MMWATAQALVTPVSLLGYVGRVRSYWWCQQSAFTLPFDRARGYSSG